MIEFGELRPGRTAIRDETGPARVDEQIRIDQKIGIGFGGRNVPAVGSVELSN